MTYEKQLINRIFSGGDENRTEWHDRWWGKELLSVCRAFSGRSQPCKDQGQSMPGRGNSTARAQGWTVLACLRNKSFQCGQSTGARGGVGRGEEVARATRSLWKVK